jgi:hypothetical protein
MGSKINILLLVIIMFAISSCDIYNMRFGALPNQNSYSHFPQRKIENQSPVLIS